MKFMEKLLVGEKVEWKKLGDLIEKYSEKAQHNKDIKKVYTISKDYGIIPSLEYWENKEQKNEYQIYSEDTGNYNVIRENMFAYNPARLNIGSIDCLFDKEPGLLSPMYVIFKIDEKKIMPNYLLLYLKSSKILQKIDSIKEPGARFRFDFERWNKIEIPLPSLKKQEEVIKKLSSFTKYITELQAELQARNKQYNYYRDMLLSEDYLNKISKKLDSLNYVLRLTTLGEIGKFTRGNGLQKKDFREKGKPVIHYGQIYTQYGFSTDKTISFAEENIFSKLRKAKPNDILIATTSENIEDVAKSTVWLGNEEVGFSGDMYSYSTNENSKYIAYYFQTAGFQKQKERKVTGTKLIRIHGEDMEKFTISLPPIEIQNKIVKILDRFQELLSDTKGLLPLEIEQRRKQYEYYREKLLTFDSICARTNERTLITKQYLRLIDEAAEVAGIDVSDKVEWKKLSEVAKYYDGTHQTPKYTESGVPFVSVQNIKDLYSTNKFISLEDFQKYKAKPEKNDIFMTRIGDVGTCALVKNNENLAYYVTLTLIKPNCKVVLSKFLKYFIESSYGKMELSKRILHNATPIKINLKDIGKIKLPLPPLPVQEYIVSILDKFDTLVNDLSQGLPKEIALRQKQYEYYREKLLDFEK